MQHKTVVFSKISVRASSRLQGGGLDVNLTGSIVLAFMMGTVFGALFGESLGTVDGDVV